jgi:phospholipid transport system substrate-binding protein
MIQEAFDLPVMTQFAVGPTWATMSDADHQALIAAFARLSTASYAHNFDKFSGQRFDIDPNVATRGPDKIVQSRLTSGAKIVQLIYRMRLAGGTWKIVDVYYDAISQLTTRRSDFQAPLASGGAKGLLAHLNTTADKLLQ